MKTRLATVGMAVLAGVTATACSSTNSTAPPASSTSGTAGIPASAFNDRTGITSTQVRVGNVSSLTPFGLFKGSLVGTQAYADYVNSTGGVNGRKIVIDSADDANTGAPNKAGTQQAINNDFALVGSFSLEDNFGGALLAQNPGMPDVSVKLDLPTGKLPNVFSASPAAGGWELGPLEYFKQKYPQAVTSAASLVAQSPSSEIDWNGEKAAMNHVGYKVVYEDTYPTSQTDFTQNVIAMKSKGVKILFIEQMPYYYAAGVVKALNQQNFHPVLVLGGATYSNALVAAAGGPAAIDGAYLEQNTSLYLGGDQASIPAVGTFLHWVQVASPGFKPDLFTLYGWLSGQLFSQALANAGSNPSRGSLLQALSKITNFDGNNIVAPANPAAKTLSNCYLIAQIKNGQFVRVDDPPVTGSTHGYRCDYSYYMPTGS